MKKTERQNQRLITVFRKNNDLYNCTRFLSLWRDKTFKKKNSIFSKGITAKEIINARKQKLIFDSLVELCVKDKERKADALRKSALFRRAWKLFEEFMKLEKVKNNKKLLQKVFLGWRE